MRAERRASFARTAAAVLAGLLVVSGLAACSASKRTVTPGIRDRAHTLEEASHETSLSGDLTRAALLQERAVAAYRSIDDVEAVAGGLNRLGNLRQRAGDRAGANAAYTEAAELARREGATAEEAAAENNLGTLAESAGDIDRARRHYETALSLAREADAPGVEAAARNNLGLVALASGDLTEAESQFEAALSIDRDEEDRAGEATRLRNLGSMHRRAGDDGAALLALEEAHALDRAREDVPAIALDLVAMSEARASTDLARAVSERRRAQDIHQFLGLDDRAAGDEERISVWCARLGGGRPSECDPRQP